MTGRDRVGLALIALGLIGILWGVLHVLEAANGPGWGPTSFEDRRGYDQVKVDVHAALPGGLVRSFAGLGLLLLGARLRRSDEDAEASPGAPASGGDGV